MVAKRKFRCDGFAIGGSLGRFPYVVTILAVNLKTQLSDHSLSLGQSLPREVKLFALFLELFWLRFGARLQPRIGQLF